VSEVARVETIRAEVYSVKILDEIRALDNEFRRIGYAGEGPHEYKIFRQSGIIEVIWMWDSFPQSPNQRQLAAMLSAVARDSVRCTEPSNVFITLMQISEIEIPNFFR